MGIRTLRVSAIRGDRCRFNIAQAVQDVGPRELIAVVPIATSPQDSRRNVRWLSVAAKLAFIGAAVLGAPGLLAKDVTCATVVAIPGPPQSTEFQSIVVAQTPKPDLGPNIHGAIADLRVAYANQAYVSAGGAAATIQTESLDRIPEPQGPHFAMPVIAKSSAAAQVLYLPPGSLRTKPNDDAADMLKAPPGSPPASRAATVEVELRQFNQCNSAVVLSAADAESALSDYFHSYSDRIQAIRDYQRDVSAFERKEPVKFDPIQQYVNAMKQLLSKCYAPAEQSTFVAKHKLASRVGSLDLGDAPLCTATSLGDGVHLITARHCLFVRFNEDSWTPLSAAQLRNLWFSPMSGGDRYQICAAEEPNALDVGKLDQLGDDHIILKTASGSPVAPAMQVAPPGTLHPYAPPKNDPEAPTGLISISVFPLAPILDPRYSTNFVVPAVPSCVVYSADNACFRHLCGTVEAASGSPIFLDDITSIRLLGTHVAFDQRSSICGLANPVSSNYGVFADTAAMHRFVGN